MDTQRKKGSFTLPLRMLIYIGLPISSVFFLWLEYIYQFEFFFHIAAIPLEILVGAFLVERFLQLEVKKQDLRRHMYIKSYTFRSGLRNVFIANLNALQNPTISIGDLRNASIDELLALREKINGIAVLEYQSDEEIEHVIREYVEARRVFFRFMEWAVNHDFESIFHDMIYLLHFIQDVTLFKENNPGELFITEARKHPRQLDRVNRILKNGVLALLDYIIQMKQEDPAILDELLLTYEQSSRFCSLSTGNKFRRRRTD